MKKIITMMLGLSLVLGAATVAFADDAPAPAKKKSGKKGKKTPPPADKDKK